MKIVVIGASSRIGLEFIDLALTNETVSLSLFLRQADKLSQLTLPHDRVRIFEGRADQVSDLFPALEGADAVFVSLAGPMPDFARAILAAMSQVGVKRLIFVTTLGILDEVPGVFGKWNQEMIGDYLPSYQEAATLIEASDCDYTILRPAWLTNAQEVDYEVTEKGTAFKGTEVSRRSVAALALRIALEKDLYIRGNIGVNKPGTDGSKPAFMA